MLSLSERTALIVLGMHRSGTSAIAGVLAQMGSDLPKELMPPTDANPKGYFESIKAYRLNDDLLMSAGSSWDDSAAFNAEWYESPRFPEYRARAAKVIEEEFGGSGFFVMKDPRMCRLLPFWQQVLADLDVGPRYVCIHRHPREVASSLTRREGWPETVGLLLWLRHVLEAEAGSRGQSRVFVSYDGLLSDWRATVARIGEGLGLSWPRHPDNAAGDIEEFLSGELRHFRAANETMPRHSLAFAWVARAYEVFERWAADGEQADDHTELDAIKVAFDEASPLLEVIAQEARGLQAKLAKAETALSNVRTESIAHAANHATEQRNRGAAEARIAELEGQFEHNALALGQAEQALLALQESFGHQEQELGRLRGCANEDQTAIANLSSALDEAARAKQQLEGDLAQMRSAFLQRGHELDELRDQTERDQRKIGRLSGELEAANDELERLEQRHERDARHLAQMARQLAPLLKQELGAVLENKRAEEMAARLEREKAELSVVKMSLETRLSMLTEEMARERDAVASQIASLRAESDAAAADAVYLRAERDAAGSEISKLTAELDSFRSLEKKVEEVGLELGQKSAALEAVTKEISALRTERDNLKPLEKKTEEARRALDHKVAELEAFKQAVASSTSWRLTAPLRGISRLLKGR